MDATVWAPACAGATGLSGPAENFQTMNPTAPTSRRTAMPPTMKIRFDPIAGGGATAAAKFRSIASLARRSTSSGVG
jgi:hypothetical protein